MVSTPQDMVSMIVAKAVNMAKQMNIEVLGVIENMGYILCPECRNRIRLIKNDTTQEFLDEMGLKLLGELPMCEEIINMPGTGT
jgi:Mrp family chromosome partitioning ATPase